MDFARLSRWQPQLLAILRIATALLFIAHGTQKFFEFPAPFPMPGSLPPLIMAAGAIELIAGGLMLIGLLTRPAAFLASGTMAVAYWMAHFPRSPWPSVNEGEAAILFCFIFLYIAAAGPGAWSVDRPRTGSRLR